jgi:hypothetical protein
LSITNSGNDFSLIEKEAVHQDSGVVDQNKNSSESGDIQNMRSFVAHRFNVPRDLGH